MQCQPAKCQNSRESVSEAEAKEEKSTVAPVSTTERSNTVEMSSRLCLFAKQDHHISGNTITT